MKFLCLILWLGEVCTDTNDANGSRMDSFPTFTNVYRLYSDHLRPKSCIACNIVVVHRKQGCVQNDIIDTIIMHSCSFRRNIHFSGGSRISRKRGGVHPLGGRGPLTWALFGENVCENQRIGSHRGVCAGHAPQICQCIYFLLHYTRSHITRIFKCGTFDSR